MDKDTTKTWLVPPTQVMYESLAEEDVKPKKRQSNWDIGDCSLCGRTMESMPAGALMGMTFGSWQEMSRYNSTSRLCKSCAWSFKDKRLLRLPVWITQGGAEFITWGELGELLSESGITSKVAVVAPHGGRKIVAPYAQFGAISADGGVFKWSSQYRKALKICEQLHTIGIRGSLLTLDAPPTQQVSALPDERQRVVYAMWDHLRFIREDKTLLGLFTKLSMNMSKREV